ncbi:hypothetical protein DPMN_090541 [Dreissena polymorpha]|uniref:Uncharacterized protein n=1 Tax=Dreissena polymorpha TaxID=45954 RepID=A0A9D4KXW7_DREPO|nr:hypothetical protein DPMN_090541 [Dreissena polymorpha]
MTITRVTNHTGLSHNYTLLTSHTKLQRLKVMLTVHFLISLTGMRLFTDVEEQTWAELNKSRFRVGVEQEIIRSGLPRPTTRPQLPKLTHINCICSNLQ